MKKIVVFTGAGISKPSGIDTFRDNDGLWDNYSVEEVASIGGWKKDREKVLNFYNTRRKQLDTVEPNDAHYALKDLEEYAEVVIITQNVDDLHERAGSSEIIHLHGELRKMRSSVDPNLIYDYNDDIKIGDKCSKGSQLRPNIVWFGEDVPFMHDAYEHLEDADYLIVIGTSLNVYPAAGLLELIDKDKIIIIDPNIPVGISKLSSVYEESAETGVRKAVNDLIDLL